MPHPPRVRRRTLAAGAVAAAVAIVTPLLAASGDAAEGARNGPDAAASAATATPIKHLVVIFQENVSFDHYFGTYPNATNPPGEPAFQAKPGTPTVNGLGTALLTDNPNEANPQRLDRSQATTCDQDHGYTAEQKAYDNGIMDQFVQNTSSNSGKPDLQTCLTSEGDTSPAGGQSPNDAVMDYYDGNTVTGLWNYAQHFAMSDNSYDDSFGPSTPGALNVVSGNTYGAICGPSTAVVNAPACTGGTMTPTAGTTPPQPAGTGTTFSDADPYFDVCSSTQDGNAPAKTIQMGGDNIGDLLNAKGLTWGWFQGGFASPNYVPGQPSTDDLSQVCTGSHTTQAAGEQAGNATETPKDYSPHHEPFQYYASTANPQHVPPTSVADIGHTDQANHQYDLKDFWAAADNGNLPAVSYLKAAEYEDGHAGYSNPLDEQNFLVNTINNLQKLPTWRSTAVVVLYDDSDGWYDHQIGTIFDQSQSSKDALTGPGLCGSQLSKVPMTSSATPEQARCGVGTRQPLLVMSPFARSNFVDSTLTTQASIVQGIEDNWLGGERLGDGSTDAKTGSLMNMFDFAHPSNSPLFLDPSTGEQSGHGGDGSYAGYGGADQSHT